MDKVEVPEGSPAESYHTGINRESAIMAERGEINRFDAVLFGSPAPFAALEARAKPLALGKPKIRGQNGYLVAALDEPERKGANLYNRTAIFLEGIIGL